MVFVVEEFFLLLPLLYYSITTRKMYRLIITIRLTIMTASVEARKTSQTTFLIFKYHRSTTSRSFNSVSIIIAIHDIKVRTVDKGKGKEEVGVDPEEENTNKEKEKRWKGTEEDEDEGDKADTDGKEVDQEEVHKKAETTIGTAHPGGGGGGGEEDVATTTTNEVGTKVTTAKEKRGTTSRLGSISQTNPQPEASQSHSYSY